MCLCKVDMSVCCWLAGVQHRASRPYTLAASLGETVSSSTAAPTVHSPGPVSAGLTVGLPGWMPPKTQVAELCHTDVLVGQDVQALIHQSEDSKPTSTHAQGKVASPPALSLMGKPASLEHSSGITSPSETGC
ncbi:hypothetical protein GBF38_017353 [Nibea albiflora]|uniref:Uncharacterized protein n=1 Tax=Nibea albiflora TaxID=240163 RepID=A0ACB7EF00_NIBAL|nr:hypothetical protein GBF38_017353 [Nibea albiflora]